MIPEPHREARLAAWLEEHRGIMHKVARAYANDVTELGDLLQEMRVQLWRSLGSFREESVASTWVYRVCLNTALTWRRDERKHLAGRVEASTLELPSREPRPGWSHEEAELVERMYAAIRELAPAERSLVLLALDGVPYREISQIVGLTENHVGVALNRARTKLAERLKGVRHEL